MKKKSDALQDIVIVFSGEWNCVKIDLAYFFAKCEFWLFIFKIIGQFNSKKDILVCNSERVKKHIISDRFKIP